MSVAVGISLLGTKKYAPVPDVLAAISMSTLDFISPDPKGKLRT